MKSYAKNHGVEQHTISSRCSESQSVAPEIRNQVHLNETAEIM